MRKFLLLLIPLFLSCSKEEQIPAPPGYGIYTGFSVSLTDHEGKDLLERIIPLDTIELKNIGEKGNTPLPYEIDPTINVLSPEFYRYHPANEKNDLSSLEISFPYSYPTSTTLITWNNNLTTDTLGAEVVYDRKENVVKLNKVSLNGKTVWTDQQAKNRSIIIKKNIGE